MKEVHGTSAATCVLRVLLFEGERAGQQAALEQDPGKILLPINCQIRQ